MKVASNIGETTSLGLLPFDLETFSSDKSQELNSFELSPVYGCKLFIYQSMEMFCTLFKVFIILH